MCILDFFNMKTLLQFSLALKLISSKCVLFQNNLLPSDTVPLKVCYVHQVCKMRLYETQRTGEKTYWVANVNNIP